MSDPTPCPACDGTGRVPLPYEPANEAWALSLAPECKACDGTGEVWPETAEEREAREEAERTAARAATAAARAGACLPVGTVVVRM